MNFIILGDKYQKGMKSKGCVGLLKINNGSNIFDTQYRCIKNVFPNSNIIYVGGFEYKKLQYFLNEKYKDVISIHNTEFENYNNLYSLSLVENFLVGDTFIVSGSYIINSKTLLQFSDRSNTQIFINNSGQSAIGCVINNNTVTNIGFDLPNTLDEIYYISHADIYKLRTMAVDQKYRNYFLFEALNLLIDNSVIIKPQYHHKIKKSNVYTR